MTPDMVGRHKEGSHTTILELVQIGRLDIHVPHIYMLEFALQLFI